MVVLFYILISLLLSRILQVFSHFLLYRKWEFKKAFEFGYESKDRWILWVGDIFSLMSAFYMYKTDQSLQFYILDGVLLIALLLTFMTDIREHLILNVYTYPLIIIMFLKTFLLSEGAFWVHISGGFGVAILLGIVMWVMKGKMGGGDLKLFIALGFYFGLFDILSLLLITSFLGCIYGLIQLKIRKKNEGFPFGPFIVLGTLILMIFDLHIFKLL